MPELNIDDLLRFTVENEASDLHISTGLPPMVRLHGDMEVIERPPLTLDDTERFARTVASDLIWQRFNESWDEDFSYEIEGIARFRVNMFRQSRGPGIVFRVIPSKVISLADLKTPDIFKTIAREPRGIVLVTGPTGSGKSTTLAAMVDEINQSEKAHILTIEDPIEFVHAPVKSLINQREVGTHTKSFAASLRAALREDPDIILVGEMRDPETIALALTAAETGHLVLGTLHTSSAAKTIDRVIDVFPANEKEMVRSMLSESLRAVISQTLMRKQGGGRVAAHEIMIATHPIRNLIRENKVPQMYSVIQTGRKIGMQTLDQALEALVDKSVVSKREAYLKAVNKKSFEG